MLLYPTQLVEGCGISTLPNVPEESECSRLLLRHGDVYSSLMARLLPCLHRALGVSGRMASAVGVCDNCGSLSGSCRWAMPDSASCGLGWPLWAQAGSCLRVHCTAAGSTASVTTVASLAGNTTSRAGAHSPCVGKQTSDHSALSMLWDQIYYDGAVFRLMKMSCKVAYSQNLLSLLGTGRGIQREFSFSRV